MEQLLTNLKHMGATLSTKQLLGLGTAFVAVVVVVAGSAFWMSKPTFIPIVSDLDAESAASVRDQLIQDRVPYQLSDGGRTVSVPVERADEVRIDLAAAGLGSTAIVGFEIFDRPAFGTTDFLEQVNYRRAIEGELARTIGGFSGISSARVQITMPERSLFLDQDQPAKASVSLKLRGNRPPSAATVAGITGVVASAVEGLSPESVVIVDSEGRPLTRPAEESAGAISGLQFERQLKLEQDLKTKVITMLEPVVGFGRVRVNVSAALAGDLVEETALTYDPAVVIRSSETITDELSGSASVGGLAGSDGNTPPPATPVPVDPNAPPPTTPPVTTPVPQTASVAEPPSGGRKSEIVNYEVGETTTRRVTPQGQLERLTVAVVLDDERVTTTAADGTTEVTTRAWEPDGIARIQGLVSAAVGLDEARGDFLIVENIPFDVPERVPDPVPPGFMEKLTDGLKQYGPSALRVGGILAVALFALFGIIRPLSKGALAAASASAPALPAASAGTARLPTVGQMEGQIEAGQAAEVAGPSSRVPALSQRVAQLASDEPEQLAGIVRGWIAEGDS